MKLKAAHILIPVAGLVVAGLLLSKKASGYLNYYIKKLAVSFSGFTPLLKIDVAVQNPSNEQFVITSIAGDVKADGSVIGSGSLFQQVVIAPNSESVLPVVVRLSPLAVVSDLINIITKQSGIPMTVGFDGYVNANGFVTPIDLVYNVT